MNPYYYKNPVSSRYEFVLFSVMNGSEWSNTAVPFKRSSVTDLKPFSELLNQKVQYENFVGVIKDCHPHNQPLTGKYYENNFYLSHKELLNMNQLVRVHWQNGLLPCWFPFFKLTLI